MMKVLEGEEPTIEETKNAIRAGVLTGQFFPVLCGSAYKNKGIQLLLDAIVEYLPSPVDIKNAVDNVYLTLSTPIGQWQYYNYSLPNTFYKYTTLLTFRMDYVLNYKWGIII